MCSCTLLGVQFFFMDEVSKFTKHLHFFSDVYSNAETELSKIYAVLMGKLVTFP